MFVGQLNLQIPWQNLYTQPVEAVLDGVYLLIVPTASKLTYRKKWLVGFQNYLEWIDTVLMSFIPTRYFYILIVNCN